MQKRILLIQEVKPVLTLSIHQNSYEDSAVKGPQVFYYRDSVQGEQLAKIIQEKLNEYLQVERPRAAKGQHDLLSSETESGSFEYCRVWIPYKSRRSCKPVSGEVSGKSSRSHCGRSRPICKKHARMRKFVMFRWNYILFRSIRFCYTGQEKISGRVLCLDVFI